MTVVGKPKPKPEPSPAPPMVTALPKTIGAEPGVLTLTKVEITRELTLRTDPNGTLTGIFNVLDRMSGAPAKPPQPPVWTGRHVLRTRWEFEDVGIDPVTSAVEIEAGEYAGLIAIDEATLEANEVSTSALSAKMIALVREDVEKVRARALYTWIERGLAAAEAEKPEGEL